MLNNAEIRSLPFVMWRISPDIRDATTGKPIAKQTKFKGLLLTYNDASVSLMSTHVDDNGQRAWVCIDDNIKRD